MNLFVFLCGAIIVLLAYLVYKIISLKQKNQVLIQSAAQQDLWTAFMSHELRTPLFAVKMHLDLLKQNRELPTALEANVNEALAASQDLITLVNDILDSAQIRSSNFALNPAPTRITEIVTSVFESFKVLAKEKGLSIDLEIAPDTPQLINLDAMRLRQVLINLFANAVKYTQEGGILIQMQPISTKAYTDSPPNFDLVTISITDTGLGIDKKEIKQIFEPFYQSAYFDSAPTSRAALAPSSSSNGLGLAIVKSIANACGWQISVQSSTQQTSRLAKGSTFKVSIPVDPVIANNLSGQVQNNLENKLASQKYCPEFSLPSAFEVLIIDDVLVNRHVLKLAFKRIQESLVHIESQKSIQHKGPAFEIITYESSNADECLQMLTQRRYDLILLDWNLPGLSGRELVKKIQAMLANPTEPNLNTTEIVLISGQLDSSLQAYAREAPAKLFLSKPIELRALEDLVTQTLSKKYSQI